MGSVAGAHGESDRHSPIAPGEVRERHFLSTSVGRGVGYAARGDGRVYHGVMATTDSSAAHPVE